jgi:O-antigen ligase
VKTTAAGSSVAELCLAFLLAVSFAVIQVLIGGTRLVFSLPAYGLLATAGLLALFSLRRARPAPEQLCLLSAVIFFGYILGRALLSPDAYLARADIYAVLGGLLVYFLIACVVIDSKRRMFILLFLLVLALLHVFVGAIQFRYGDNFMLVPHLHRFDYDRRASGLYVCPNHLAGLLEVLGIFGLSILWWSRWPTWAKLLIGYATGVCYLGLVLTGSRGGYLSAVTSLLVFAGLSLWTLRSAGSTLFWRIGGLGALAALIIGGAVAFSVHKSDYLSGRAQNVFDVKNIRIELWRAALQQWKTEPLFGTGSGTYLYYGRQFRSPVMQLDPVRAHNDYLDLLAEYGLAGAAGFLIFLALHLRSGWKNFKRLGPRRVAVSARLLSNGMALQIGAIAAVSAYVVHSIFDFNLHIPANLLLLAFVFGILANPGGPRPSDPALAATNFVWWRLLLPILGIIVAVQCVRLWPGEYFAEQARAFVRDNHAGHATASAVRGLETEKNNPNLYDYIGNADLLRGDARTKPEERAWFYRDALKQFKEAWRLAPLDETFALELGYTYDVLGRFREAEWMFYEALRLDPKSTSVKQYYERHLKRWRDAGSASPQP